MQLLNYLNFGLAASFIIAFWLARDSLALGLGIGLGLGLAVSLTVSRLRLNHSGEQND